MGQFPLDYKIMRSFAFLLLASVTLAAEWSDSSIKVTTKQMACYADMELYNIMKTGSDFMAECDQSRGDYPTGGKMGKAFCLFDYGSLDTALANYYNCVAAKLSQEARDRFE